MSYLDVPRIHFGGLFFTNPDTINNYIKSYQQSTQLTNAQGAYLTNDPNGDQGPSGWNAMGTAQLWLSECSVLSVVGPSGTLVSDPSADPVIGATVQSPSPTTPKTTPDGKGYYDIAKLVDLDPYQQARSAVYGLRIYVALGNGAGFSGLMTVPELQYLEGRVPGAQSSWGAVGTWMGQITDVTWTGDIASSPFLSQFQAACGNGVAVKLTTDLHQNNNLTQLTPGNIFCYGRILGSLGPIQPGELPQVVPGRIIQVPIASSTSNAEVLMAAAPGPESAPALGSFTIDARFRQHRPPRATSSILATADAGDTIDAASGAQPLPWNPAPAQVSQVDGGSMLHVDLGGSILIEGTIASNGVGSSTGQFLINDGITIGYLNGSGAFQAFQNGQVSFTSLYQTLTSQNKQVDLVTTSGLVDIPLEANEASLVASSPLAVSALDPNVGAVVTVLQEPTSGLSLGSGPFSVRLVPDSSTPTTIQLMARKFGVPIVGQQPATVKAYVVADDIGTLLPSTDVSVSWNGSTDANGIGTLQVSTVPADPTLPPLRQPLDSQIYYVYFFDATGQIIGDGYGQPVGTANGSLSVLRFQTYVPPAVPSWQQDVGPILQAYARLYPGMKDRLDIGDEATVKQFASALLQRMPPALFLEPIFMPVTRDMSPVKSQMIVAWLETQVSPPNA